MLRSRHVFMDQAGDTGAAGAGGGQAGAGAGGSGLDGVAAGGVSGSGAGAGQGPGTALSAAAQAAAAQGAGQGQAGQQGAQQQGSQGDPLAGVPAKYQVKGADGKIDVGQTLAKVSAAHAALETRLGAGDAPPATPEGYKPDAVYAAIKTATGKDLTLPPETISEFNKFAHDAKLNQAQYDKSLTAWMAAIPRLAEEGFQHAMKTGTAELEKVWGADAKDPKSERMQNTYRAFSRFAPEKLRTPEVMDQIGNHPVVMQILEAVGRELKSDKAPNDQGGQVTGASRLDQIYADQAYWNAKDPRHAALVSEAQQLFAKGNKPTAMQGRGGVVKL